MDDSDFKILKHQINQMADEFYSKGVCVYFREDGNIICNTEYSNERIQLLSKVYILYQERKQYFIPTNYRVVSDDMLTNDIFAIKESKFYDLFMDAVIEATSRYRKKFLGRSYISYICWWVHIKCSNYVKSSGYKNDKKVLSLNEKKLSTRKKIDTRDYIDKLMPKENIIEMFVKIYNIMISTCEESDHCVKQNYSVFHTDYIIKLIREDVEDAEVDYELHKRDLFRSIRTRMLDYMYCEDIKYKKYLHEKNPGDLDKQFEDNSNEYYACALGAIQKCSLKTYYEIRGNEAPETKRDKEINVPFELEILRKYFLEKEGQELSNVAINNRLKKYLAILNEMLNENNR